MTQNKNTKGTTDLVILAAVVIIVASILGWLFYLRDTGTTTGTTAPTTQEIIEMGELPISASTDLDTIEAELDATQVGSPEEDFEVLDQDASSL